MTVSYPFSFSGADVRAFVYTENTSDTGYFLDSLATISFQINEQKSPVRRLGRPHVVGFTKSIRTIAGTMVLIILRDHPAAKHINQGRYKSIGVTSDTLNSNKFFTNSKPFDLRLTYQSEDNLFKTGYSDNQNGLTHSELLIQGIEIISQSIVTSINDMMTEVVVQFMAKDCTEFSTAERIKKNAESQSVSAVTNNNSSSSGITSNSNQVADTTATLSQTQSANVKILMKNIQKYSESIQANYNKLLLIQNSAATKKASTEIQNQISELVEAQRKVNEEINEIKQIKEASIEVTQEMLDETASMNDKEKQEYFSLKKKMELYENVAAQIEAIQDLSRNIGSSNVEDQRFFSYLASNQKLYDSLYGENSLLERRIDELVSN